jgi:hypothetical protein
MRTLPSGFLTDSVPDSCDTVPAAASAAEAPAASAAPMAIESRRCVALMMNSQGRFFAVRL